MTAKPAGPTDWEIEPLPQQRTTVVLDQAFSPEEMNLVRAGHIPEVMEDKWFIYWQDETLYFHRSWTGYCIFVVRFAVEGHAGRMVSADVNRDHAQCQLTDDAEDAQTISSLIDVLLLGRGW